MTAALKKILVVDDEAAMRHMLQLVLEKEGYQVTESAEGGAALELLQEEPFDMVLCDIRMPGMDGRMFLREVARLKLTPTIIMMSAYGTIDTAIECMKAGAYDYISKPFKPDEVVLTLKKAEERFRLRQENLRLREELARSGAPSGTGGIIYRSAAMAQVMTLVGRVAGSASSVLVTGETGTGKELVARALHQQGERREGVFVAVNCGAISSGLLESELFGHVKGAFTGAVQAQKGLLEEAHEGTLFLDEIGDLSPVLQAKLLRVLQEGEFIPVGATRTRQVDVRFLAATNKDLEAEVARGQFREDLFYRLNVIALQLPPLRERPEDIEPLALHFLGNLARKLRRPLKGLTPDALAAMQAYRWPGNVRELENVIERCAILARGETIAAALLPFRRLDGPLKAPRAAPAPPALSLREAERGQVLRALQETAWNKSRAAQLLGVTRKTLDRKIKDFQLAQAELPDRL